MKHISLLFVIFISLLITACGGGDTNPSSGGYANIIGNDQIVTGSKSISVRWDIPTTKVNGDSLSLSEIAGFKIYVASNNNFIPTQANVTITDSAATDFVINNLASGTYYIYITTYDINGDESPYSSPITQTV